MQITIQQRGQGIGAIIYTLRHFIPVAKKLKLDFTINPETWIYFENKEFDQARFDQLFKLHPDAKREPPGYTFSAYSIEALSKADIKPLNHLEVIDLKEKSELYKGFRIACHARFGLGEKSPEDLADLKTRVVTKQRYWHTLKEYLEPGEKFFLASDNANFICETKAHFPGQVIHYDHQESGAIASHVNNTNPVQALYEAMQDLISLSYAETLIFNRSSLSKYAAQKVKKAVALYP